MAVLPSLPGLTTVVRTASGPLSEYPDPDADDRNKTHTSCYIEAQSGQSFEVEWTFRDGSVFALCQCVEVEIHLDGNYAQSTVVEAHDRHRTPTMSWKGVRVVDDAGHNVRLFTFAELTTVEDLNTGSQTVKQLKHLGEIEVRWIRARHLSVEPATKQNSTSNYKSVVDSGEIAEKKLKGRAISHQATLSKAEKIAPYNIIRLDYPRGRTPFATYIFKYRSRKALQAQFIIPRTPSPAPLEARAIESLTEDELRERLRRAEQANAQQVKIKQEMKRERATQIHSSDKDDDGEEAVQIHSVHVRKRLKTMFDAGLGVEVIDLSED